MRWTFVAGLLAACSFEHGKLPGAGAGDGGSIDSADEGDGGGGGADGGGGDASTQLGPWGTAQLLGVLNSAGYDDDPTLTGDLLELYFDSDRSGTADIWRASRNAANQPWSAPTRVDELSTTGAEGEPEIAADGLTIWIARYSSNSDWDIYVSTRTNRATAWTTPVLVGELNTNATDFHLSPDATNMRALVNSNRPSVAGDYDIYSTTRSSPTGTWTNPVAVGELNTSSHDGNVNFAADALSVYFDSERSGNRDLYVARRSTVTGAFGTPQRIVELASVGRDSDAAVSADQRLMVFASDRSGNMQLYESTR